MAASLLCKWCVSITVLVRSKSCLFVASAIGQIHLEPATNRFSLKTVQLSSSCVTASCIWLWKVKGEGKLYEIWTLLNDFIDFTVLNICSRKLCNGYTRIDVHFFAESYSVFSRIQQIVFGMTSVFCVFITLQLERVNQCNQILLYVDVLFWGGGGGVLIAKMSTSVCWLIYTFRNVCLPKMFILKSTLQLKEKQINFHGKINIRALEIYCRQLNYTFPINGSGFKVIW